ncbi:hypothetical protein SFRURICE_018379 [Spodoptera frugiperda]|nr:hypothetical protein SFRURICE_018379 [Spodoptera frugiperda]
MEELLALQEELFENLKKAERNYKKTPKERIKRQYIETRLELLEQIFQEFKNRHKEVIANSKNKKESYFTEDKYDSFEELYVQYKSNLREALQHAVMRTLFGTKKIQTESATAIRTLLDTTSTCLKSLQNLGISTESSFADASIVHMVVSKLDSESVKQWEQQLNVMCDELPTWIQLRDYLECRFRTLMTPKERQNFVQSTKLCFNCLASTHAVTKCRQSFSCKKCGRRHHTMLHFERENQEPASNLENATATSSSAPQQERATTTRGETTITATFSRGELQPNSVLLATAQVKVIRSNGFKQIIRALLDQGSQASFVSESTVQLLGLTRKPVSGWVSGLGDGRLKIKVQYHFVWNQNIIETVTS